MNMCSTDKIRRWLAVGFILLAMIFLVLYLSKTEQSSPEYIYTVNILTSFCLIPSIAFAVLLHPGKHNVLNIKRWFLKICCLITLITFAFPIMAPPSIQMPWQFSYALSISWIISFCSASLFFFLLASLVEGQIKASLLSIFASLLLALSCMETYMLCSDNASDGIWYDSSHSKHLSESTGTKDNNYTGKSGTFPKATGSIFSYARRMLKFDDEVYDCKFTFDANGHRITPTYQQTPENEILIFGCSYSFGDCLNDEQTWPWQLGKLLGDKWLITNYAYSGFGPAQMLTLLEDGLVSTKASKKIAFFLGIKHQLRRNAGLIEAAASVRYSLDKQGRIYRDGLTTDSNYKQLFTIKKFFNGSQLANYLTDLIINAIVTRKHDEFVNLYLAILKESANRLDQEYGIPLIVLLWPDMEYLEREINLKGIQTIKIRSYLKHWNDQKDGGYYIHPRWEQHPNQKACEEISIGLKNYLENYQ